LEEDMPAPDDFDGIFYSPQTGGTNELFDSAPEDFIQMCIEHESPLGSAEFFVAGALADLLLLATSDNDYAERYQRLYEAAVEKWPTHYWNAIPVVIMTARAVIREGADRQHVRTGVSRTMGGLFGAAEIHTSGDTIVIQGRRVAQTDKTAN
jgi:hypothetical protein